MHSRDEIYSCLMISIIYIIYNVTYKISYMKEIIFLTTKKKAFSTFLFYHRTQLLVTLVLNIFTILNHSGHLNIVFADKIYLIVT